MSELERDTNSHRTLTVGVWIAALGAILLAGLVLYSGLHGQPGHKELLERVARIECLVLADRTDPDVLAACSVELD